MSDLTILANFFLQFFTQGVSVTNKDRQLKNKYKHRLSHEGYTKLEQVMVKEKPIAQETSQLLDLHAFIIT